jgi:hypothetical protein
MPFTYVFANAECTLVQRSDGAMFPWNSLDPRLMTRGLI